MLEQGSDTSDELLLKAYSGWTFVADSLASYMG
jgi:hypothetical protein